MSISLDLSAINGHRTAYFGAVNFSVIMKLYCFAFSFYRCTHHVAIMLCVMIQDVCKVDVIRNGAGNVINYAKSCGERSQCSSFRDLQCSVQGGSETCNRCLYMADSCFCPGKLPCYIQYNSVFSNERMTYRNTTVWTSC